MKDSLITRLLTVLIIAGLCTGPSCAQKNVGTLPGALEDSAENTEAVQVSDVDKDAGNLELRQRLIREKELAAERLAAEKLTGEMERFVNEMVFFEFNRCQLSGTAKEQLKEKAAWLNAHSDFSIVVEGHCDQRGTLQYNRALGERRALAVKKFLQDFGVSSHRVTWVSFGEEKLLRTGQDEEDHQKNRRARIRFQSATG
jgi:peptidoglycan-associated lipoprotein